LDRRLEASYAQSDKTSGEWIAPSDSFRDNSHRVVSTRDPIHRFRLGVLSLHHREDLVVLFLKIRHHEVLDSHAQQVDVRPV
jgi:hypothetical protein